MILNAKPLTQENELTSPSQTGCTNTSCCPQSGPSPFKRETAKVGRNDPCPCGKPSKFKKCCGKQN